MTYHERAQYLLQELRQGGSEETMTNCIVAAFTGVWEETRHNMETILNAGRDCSKAGCYDEIINDTNHCSAHQPTADEPDRFAPGLEGQIWEDISTGKVYVCVNSGCPGMWKLTNVPPISAEYRPPQPAKECTCGFVPGESIKHSDWCDGPSK